MVDADIRTKILIMVPVAFAIMLLILAGNITFKDGISDIEYQILDFEYKDLTVQEKDKAAPVIISEGPLDRTRKMPGHEISTSSDISARAEDLEVSLTVVSGGSKMAIIQGVLVKEGDIIDDKKVIKIEPGRVLIKNKTNQWIKVKK